MLWRKPLKVLFIGNSLTFFTVETGEGRVVLNDLPGLLERMARSRREKLAAGRVCAPGRTLEDHWESGTLDGNLRPGAWDLVVLQESTARASSEEAAMKRAARLLHARIAATGARTALFSAGTAPRSLAAYAELSAELGAALIPAGEAWALARGAREDLELNLPDGIHPNPLGVYLNACVFYARLFGEVVGSSDDLEAVRAFGVPFVSSENLAFLRAVAARVKPPVAGRDGVPAE